MDLPVRKRLPHTVPQWVPEGSWFFITINCEPRGKNQLCQEVGRAAPCAPDPLVGHVAPRAPEPSVGRITPCAPPNGVQGIARPTDAGAHGVTRPTRGDAVLAAMEYNHEQAVWHCRLCLLMPDHLHAILAFPRAPGMAMAIKNWKHYVAAKCGVNWQRDFFDHRLRDHHELDEKISYLLMNPVRKGLCERAADWRWIYRPNDPPPLW